MPRKTDDTDIPELETKGAARLSAQEPQTPPIAPARPCKQLPPSGTRPGPEHYAAALGPLFMGSRRLGQCPPPVVCRRVPKARSRSHRCQLGAHRDGPLALEADAERFGSEEALLEGLREGRRYCLGCSRHADGEHSSGGLPLCKGCVRDHGREIASLMKRCGTQCSECERFMHYTIMDSGGLCVGCHEHQTGALPRLAQLCFISQPPSLLPLDCRDESGRARVYLPLRADEVHDGYYTEWPEDPRASGEDVAPLYPLGYCARCANTQTALHLRAVQLRQAHGLMGREDLVRALMQEEEGAPREDSAS